MVVAIGWIDWFTGPDIGLSLLYLVPVAFAGWYGGVAAAIFVGLAAGSAWLTADVALRHSDTAIAISVWNAFTRYIIYVSQGVLFALVHRDREKLRKLAARESSLARTDLGTRLPNARAFMELLEAELEEARERGEAVCVAYLDLDNFKEVNDRYGHAAGDEVLQNVATAIQRSIRGHDVAARLGGDEFGVLLRGVDPLIAQTVGERISARIREIGTKYAGATLGATLGVAFFQSLPETASALLQAADGAMYAGKSSGKGRVVVQNL